MKRPRIGGPGTQQDVGTPPRVIRSVLDRLLQVPTFAIDLAASNRYHVCEPYFTKEIDAFAQDWAAFCGWKKGWAWLNSPFDDIEPWAIRCFEEARKGAYICQLVPAATDTEWWRLHVNGKAYVVFIQGRFAFEGHRHGYPKPLALLIWMPWVRGGSRYWKWAPPRVKRGVS